LTAGQTIDGTDGGTDTTGALDALSRARAALRDLPGLAVLRRIAIEDPHADEAFGRLTRLAAAVLKTPVALVSIADQERLVFKGRHGLPEPWASLEEIPLAGSFCGHVVENRTPLVIGDARLDLRLSEYTAVRELGVVAYLGIPLIAPCGHVLGTLCVIDHTPRVWREDQIQVLEELGISIMTEIELHTATLEVARYTSEIDADGTRDETQAIVEAGAVVLDGANKTGRADGSRAPDGLADDVLVALVAARGAKAEDALAALYDRYSASVYGLALRMVRDRRTAEELLQETFWRLWRHAGQYQAGRVRFATWLLRIATNLALSELRQLKRRPVAALAVTGPDGGEPDMWGSAGEPADPSADVPEQVWHGEQRRLVATAMATLPAEQRQAVELAYFYGQTHREIARAQGAPPSTVKTRLALGLRKLSASLALRGLERELLTTHEPHFRAS